MEKALLIPVFHCTVAWSSRRVVEGLTEPAQGALKCNRGISDPCGKDEPWLERCASQQGWWCHGPSRAA